MEILPRALSWFPSALVSNAPPVGQALQVGQTPVGGGSEFLLIPHRHFPRGVCKGEGEGEGGGGRQSGPHLDWPVSQPPPGLEFLAQVMMN